MSKVRYLGIFKDASYSSYDREYMDAYTSIEDAKEAMRSRQSEYDYVTTYRENADGLHVLWESRRYTIFPATTQSAVMELYKVQDGESRDGALYVADSPTHRLTIGGRGGVIKENY